MSTTTDLSTLKINYLTQAQYDAALSGNTINEDELYLTPESSADKISPMLELDTSAASGTDHDLYAAITDLGWESEVIVSA